MTCPRTLIAAAMIADGAQNSAAPGAILLENSTIIASGSPESIGEVLDAQRIDLPRKLVIPALVNAHAHLDLTHIGPIPSTGSFAEWISRLQSQRASDDAGIEASVRRGVELSIAGGTALIADIAGVGSIVPIRTLRDSPLGGVSFLEVFGNGTRQSHCIEMMRQVTDNIDQDAGSVTLGLQPHSPYSCGIEVYEAARSSGLPLSTHLAETLEEIQFIMSGDGPLIDLLRQFGAWDASIEGAGQHPIDHLESILSKTPCLAAHLNYIDDRHLALLAAWPLGVAYCPRAGAYFGHPHHDHHPHRYRDMLASGINVALGTDSMLCLDTPDRISVLDEMRLLHRRDNADPRLLLQMGTTNGAIALGVEPSRFTLDPGPVAGLIALDINPDNSLDPLRQILDGDAPPEWLSGPH